MTLASERLILRQWRGDDREAFVALNADPVVMEFFPATRTRAQADAVLDILIDHIEKHGFGFWGLELRETGENIGFTGLQNTDFDARFCPAVEIGWRLARPHWGRVMPPKPPTPRWISHSMRSNWKRSCHLPWKPISARAR